MVWDIWDPYEEARKLRRELEAFFKPGIKGLIREPLVDVTETDKEIIVKAELPGVDKKDIDLQVKEDMISIKAEKEKEAELKEKGYYKHERHYAGFARAFSLPARVVPEKTTAKLEKGVLEIRMQKAVPTKKEAMKKIEIK